MKTILHTANSRGHVDHGWLKSAHSFSFGNYYNPKRMGFGALRVINDDYIEGNGGFPAHPHNNMEIITIPLRGSLAHKDNMGHEKVILEGDVQLMSAGTGVVHSEFNHSSTEPVELLQIWVLPERNNVTPRYAQRAFPASERKNKWQPVVAPFPTNDDFSESEEGPIFAHQQTYFSMTTLQAKHDIDYHTHHEHHIVYFFVISGEVTIANQALSERDALGVLEASTIQLKAVDNSEILAIEVPY